MREIKFRALFFTENEWVDFTLEDISKLGNIMINYKYWRQSTGLTDKNGKMIYEGDVLSDGDEGSAFFVEWCDAGYWCLCYGDICESKPINSLHMLEIIGNIYKNPNLI